MAIFACAVRDRPVSQSMPAARLAGQKRAADELEGADEPGSSQKRPVSPSARIRPGHRRLKLADASPPADDPDSHGMLYPHLSAKLCNCVAQHYSAALLQIQ